jgi:ATP-dependent Clp protease ATP-binding subunit ClpX
MTSSIMECNFCGKHRQEVIKLIVANDAGICNECIDLCYNILDQERIDVMLKDRKVSRALNPVKIKEFLDQYVIGQDACKQSLAVAVVNHSKRVYFNPKIELEKSNLLMFGPSGSGKTLLAKMVARYLNVPFVIADATTLTEAGYVGDDVESLIGRLLSAADGDVTRAQKGIIFIDEIDKIGRKSESSTLQRDVSGEGVQQALLKLVEGTICSVSGPNGRRSDSVEVDTTNVLFIAGGAFDGLDDIVKNRKQGSGMGFTRINDPLPQPEGVTPKDLMRFGMIPEFVGRFPVTVKIDQLSLADLESILSRPKNNLLAQMKFYFESDGIELDFDSGAIAAIANEALHMGIGARGLKSVIERVMTPLMFNIPAMKKQAVKRITITQEVITNNEQPKIEEHEKLQTQ